MHRVLCCLQVKFLWDFQQSFRQLQQQHGQAPALSSYATATNTTNTSSSSSSSIGDPFGPDSCMGIAGTLHCIAAIRDIAGSITGLSYRIGRYVPGVAMLLADVLSSLNASTLGPSSPRLNPGTNPGPKPEVQQLQGLLLLGRRGVGKTTLLRDIARVMSLPEEQGGMGLAVLVVDTYCDIAGAKQDLGWYLCCGWLSQQCMIDESARRAGWHGAGCAGG
jgi:stage III sporulation protein SpoIIIAA